MFRSRTSNRRLLNVEALSDRVVPAVIVTPIDLDGDGATDDVRIVGDTRNNKITIADNGVNQVQVQVDANGDGDFVDVAAGDQAVQIAISNNSFVADIQLRAGNDQLAYNVTGTMSNGARSIKVDLGVGNDTFTWLSSTIDNGSAVSLDVFGNAGLDNVNATFGQFKQSVLNLQTNLSSGNDKSTLTFNLIDNKSSVDVQCDLGSGNNTQTIDLQGIGKFDQANVDFTVLGGMHADVVNLDCHDDVGGGLVPSHLGVNVDLGSGNDAFNGKLDGNNFVVDNMSQALFAIRGGIGNDQLRFERNGTGFIRVDELSLLSINMDGGIGNDTVVADFGSTDAFQLKSTSVFKLRLEGGIGNDLVSTKLSNDANSAGAYDVGVRGGAGNDTMLFNLTNNGGAPTYGPAGGALIDGGTGVDILSTTNAAITMSTDFETFV